MIPGHWLRYFSDTSPLPPLSLPLPLFLVYVIPVLGVCVCFIRL